jgi:hypothetical protein
MRCNPLVLVNLVIAADQHWQGGLPAMRSYGDINSFRGLYAVLYRQYSGVAHPTYRGLNAVVQDVTAVRKRLVVEGPYEGHGRYGMATVIYAPGCRSPVSHSHGRAKTESTRSS